MRTGHDFRRAEGEAHGGVLEQDGVLVGPCGDGNAQGLGQNDGTDALHVRHAESAARLELSRGQTLDGAPENLRLIGRAGQPKHGAGGADHAQIQSDDIEQAEIEKKKQQKRGVKSTTVKVTDPKTGKVTEKNLSASEMNKRRLEYARQLDAERYKDERTVPLSELNKQDKE